MNLSKPVMGMLLGICTGVALGMLMVRYFDVSSLMDQVALISCVVLVLQLLGATIGATLGKPHQDD